MVVLSGAVKATGRQGAGWPGGARCVRCVRCAAVYAATSLSMVQPTGRDQWVMVRKVARQHRSRRRDEGSAGTGCAWQLVDFRGGELTHRVDQPVHGVLGEGHSGHDPPGLFGATPQQHRNIGQSGDNGLIDLELPRV